MTGKRKTDKGAGNPAPTAVLEFEVPQGEYSHAIRSQREWGAMIAGALERGESLSPSHANMVAQIVRRWADRLSDTQPRGRGQAREFDHADAAIEYAMAKLTGREGVTQSTLAEKYGVTVEAMTRALKRNLPAAERFLSSLGEDDRSKSGE